MGCVMDIYRFTNPTHPVKMEYGEIINWIKRKTWIERYRDMSEFTLVADLSSGVREKLPVGSFISHINTREIMIVESHEISDNGEAEPEITISGRSFEQILENRLVRAAGTYPSQFGVFDHIVATGYTWDQVENLIDFFTINCYDANDEIPWLEVQPVGFGSATGVQVQRQIEMGNLYERIQEIMDIDNLGLKVVSPGKNPPQWTSHRQNTTIVIHKGEDKSGTAIFSHYAGDIESADYLWSKKNFKTAAVISGRWIATMVSIGGAENQNYGRRLMHVDGSSIDSAFEASPTGTDLTNVVNRMQQRGWAALSKKLNLSIANVEINKQLTQARYRVDYNIGDLVGVIGNYDTFKKMRVVEYVEIEDENGSQSYPTLADPSSV